MKKIKVCSRTDVAAACGLQKPLVHGKTDVKTTREAVVIHMLKNLGVLHRRTSSSGS